MSSDRINWSRMSLEELQRTWNTEVESTLQRDGIDLDDRPTYQAVADAGYGGITYALREHHDMTLTEFLETVGYVDSDDTNGYQWGIDDETTVDALEAFMRRVERKRAESTARSNRYRLATYVRLYEAVHGSAGEIVSQVRSESNRNEEIPRVEVVLDELDSDLESDASKLRYLSDVTQFYDHLESRHSGAFNPAQDVDHAEMWEPDEPDNPALESEQVKALYDAAESSDEEFLVLALCAWGLRRSEAASLHVSQFVLEDADPHIAFDGRKNGPGTVALIYGVPKLFDRIDRLGSRDCDWNGYLFPSNKSASGHVTGETIQARFERLAERADVRVLGEKPTSKMGRRFWYTTYNDAVNELLDNLDVIAGEQGSSDPSVVLKNYLSEAERRKYRREFMRDRLIDAFGE